MAFQLDGGITNITNSTIKTKGNMVYLPIFLIQDKDNEDSLSSLYSRVGVRAAKGFTLASGWQIQLYAEINAITSRNNHSKIHYTNAALNVESSRGRFESAVGFNAGFANHRLGLEISRTDGKRFDKPYAVQAVYRYSW